MAGPDEDLEVLSERDRLISAVIELCSEKGWQELREREVAAKAGLADGAFAVAFPEGIASAMAAAQAELSARVMGSVWASYSVDQSEWESGLRAMRSILEMFDQDRALAYFGFITTIYAAPKAVRDSQRSMRQAVASMIDRLREGADFLGAPPRASEAVLGGADAVVRRALLSETPKPLTEVMPSYVYGAAVPFFGQEQALWLARQTREYLERGR